MNVDVFFTPAEVNPQRLSAATAVVIDVIRATSTIVEALANGARAIYPTESIEEALRLAESLGREDTLLCGERRGVQIDGFDLGNSPSEFTRDRIGGKRLVMTTTNGTRALIAASSAARVVITSLLNLTAVAESVGGVPHLVIACAGKDDRFSLDDALCAGLLLRQLGIHGDGSHELNDSARTVLCLIKDFDPTAEVLAGTAAGRVLIERGLGADLPDCADRDRRRLVPVMIDRVIRLAGSAS
jgi:2-phosphosulfolactate phosphatase